MWIAGLSVRVGGGLADLPGSVDTPSSPTLRALPVATTEDTPVTMEEVIGTSGEGSGGMDDQEGIGSGSGDSYDYDYDCGEGGPCLAAQQF